MPTHPIAADSLHRRLLTAGAVLAVALATVATPVGAAARGPEQPGASTTTPLIVTLDDNATASVASLAETLGAQVEGLAAETTPLPRSNAMSVTVAGSDVAAARQRLAQHPEVASVERDATVQAHTTPVSVAATPNDPRYPQQWALPHINAPEAWSQTTGSSSVRVAVLDTGVDASHTDLADNIGRSYNAVGSGDATTDSYGHGTKAAGVAAAVTNNLTAVAGVCWNCEIWPVKVMADDGSGLHSDVAEGVRWAADAGADVIALSLGGHGRTSTLERAIGDAVDSGAVVVASAGNYGTSEPVFPAAYDDAMGVAALDRDDQRTSYSSYGDWVSVGAPGCTQTTESDGGTVRFCGTSAAAPHVAGLVGLATAHGATPQGARSAIRDGAHPTGQGMGHGRIDAEATLELVDQADDGSTGDGSTNDGSSGDGSGSDGSGSDGSGGDGSSGDGSGSDGSGGDGSSGDGSGGDGSSGDGSSGDGSGGDGSNNDGSSGDGDSSRDDEPTVQRVVGSTRYATAAKLSAANVEVGTERVYLATGQGYADALAAGAAAGSRDGPVLLAARHVLPPATAAELSRIAPQEVVVVGGEQVLSEAVATAAGNAAQAPVTRRAGASRFSTAASLAETETAQVVYLATGEEFADALAGVPAAVAENAPMLLTGRDVLPQPTRDALTRLSPQRVVMLGGPQALSQQVRQRVHGAVPGASVQRLAGDDRFATAATIAETVFGGQVVNDAVVATGGTFADALAAGPVAGASDSPLLLVGRDAVPAATEGALRRLAPSQSLLLGGLGAVSDGVAGSLADILQ